MDAPEYVPPLDPLVADAVGRLDAGLREAFEERAGIIEYDGKLPRAHAECLALIGVLVRHPSCLTGLAALEVELDGTPHWLLTTNLTYARRHLEDRGGIEIDVLDPADVVGEKCGGAALLSTFT